MIQLQALNQLISSRDYSWLTVNQIDETYFSDYAEEYAFIRDSLYWRYTRIKARCYNSNNPRYEDYRW